MGFRVFIAVAFILLNACGSSDKNTFQGYVDSQLAYIASPYSGILKTLKVNKGQWVKKNQLLFILDPDPQALVVKQAQADLEQAAHTLKDLENPKRPQEIDAIKAQIAQTEAALELAKIRVARRQKLFERQAGDKESVDLALADVKEQTQLKQQYEANLRLALLGSREEQIRAQQQQIAALTSKLAEAKWDLAQKTVYASNEGYVFDTYHIPGEFVPNQQSVLSILAQEDIYINFFIPVELLSKIHLKQKVRIECDGCDFTAEASIGYISPQAEYLPPLVYSRENNSKLVFRVEVYLKNTELFRVGQPVRVHL
jgi:HlyD family secretion protein